MNMIESMSFAAQSQFQAITKPSVRQSSGTGNIINFSRELSNIDVYPTPLVRHTVPKTHKITSAKTQLKNLQDYVGFNVSQLASILHVERPTIYMWLEGNEPNRTNQERLDTIYSIFEYWYGSHLRLGNYIYKNIEGTGTLYNLLKSNKINKNNVMQLTEKIRNMLLLIKEKGEKRIKLSKQARFKPISKKEKIEKLDRLIRKA